ncbi:grasp-with-spasm system ATP-grasp peptide maturase [Flavobacterium suzhouense]|uniref:Grasp-with-spasm system ATP-grasp peptide maturase n=1 Tax=Flavobacterium suzhouense TaxID=1529638 RepID=A0ABW5NVF1_9FLAO
MSEKMILICTDVSEASSDVVCSWLQYNNKKFLRISYENIITIKTVFIKDDKVDFLFSIDDTDYHLSDFKSYWYRRSRLKFAPFSVVEYIHEGVDLSNRMNAFLEEEYFKLIEFFQYEINKIAVLNRYEDNNINKLQVLSMARDCGINIPETSILDNAISPDVNQNEYITKAISDFILYDDKSNYFCTTDYISVDGPFSYSLIQKEVKKKFEIRSFFMKGKFFSSAIFSQENEKTKLDFRNYDFENPNRVVPFSMPAWLEERLAQLMQRIGLNSGSFDLAYTHDNKYVLFEVNPVGQFEQVSFPCNYSIHKLIAHEL